MPRGWALNAANRCRATAYHLTAASPCRNAGSDALAAMGVDLDGNPRKVGRHVDLGCFEFGGTGMSVLVR